MVNRAPQPAPPPPAEAPAAVGDADDAVRAKVLEIVADKTGYPTEMLDLDLDLEIEPLEGWCRDMDFSETGLPWVMPSPNMPSLDTARVYPGMCLLEATNLSEGRGTTRPLELFGAPDLEPRQLLAEMHRLAPHWLQGCRLRECWFEPTFHKHAGKLCAGVQIHVEDGAYDHEAFRPWRLMALAFKALRKLRPDYELWRDFPYEYEFDRLAIDLINGSELLRQWVDDPEATPDDLDALAGPDQAAWLEELETVRLYA